MISSSHRPLPDNTQHSHKTNIRAPGRIRTHDLSRRAAADLRLRPRGQWDRQTYYIMLVNSITGSIQATIHEGRMRHAGHMLASPVVAIGIHWIPGSHCAQRLILRNTPTCRTDRLIRPEGFTSPFLYEKLERFPTKHFYPETYF